MRTIRTFLPTTFCLILALAVAGCGSTGLEDILGGGGSPSAGYGDLRGTVQRVDTGARIIWVEAESGYRTDLRNEEDQVALYYDDRTVVEFEGRDYEPQDLERGDRIAADVDQSGSRLVADRIEVLSDVSRGGSTGGSTGSYADVRGVVRYVDTGDRTIELEDVDVERSFETDVRSGRLVLHYDADTVVRFEGRSYDPENLERGDEVEVEVRDLGGRLLAEEIEVVQDARASSRF